VVDFSRLTIGLEGTAEIVVGEQHTAPRVGSGRVHVLTFRVEAFDEKERVGDGTHARVVVNVARFDERVQRKLLPASPGG
jgi:predicted thioesterase